MPRDRIGPASIATKPPHRIWNAIGSVATLGADNAPGPIPVIPDSGNFQFFSLPGGIGQSLQVTFQGIIEDPCSRGAIPYSITNAVLLQVD